jgi:hypothetical protein
MIAQRSYKQCLRTGNHGGRLEVRALNRRLQPGCSRQEWSAGLTNRRRAFFLGSSVSRTRSGMFAARETHG